MDRAVERRKAIDAAVADIREIEKREGVNRAGLEKIKAGVTTVEEVLRETVL